RGFFYFFFFFSSRRRHTRFSRDWSSDVCSSDLTAGEKPANLMAPFLVIGLRAEMRTLAQSQQHEITFFDQFNCFFCGLSPYGSRSEERRVGKECRSRRAREHKTK